MNPHHKFEKKERYCGTSISIKSRTILLMLRYVLANYVKKENHQDRCYWLIRLKKSFLENNFDYE